MRSPLATIFFTVFMDLLGVGIAIPTTAVVLLNPHSGLLSPSVVFATRTFLLGLLIASYPLAQFFGAPILGALSDRFGRKKILTLSLLGTFVGYIFFASGILAHSLLLLFLSRIIDGFTGGNISIALSAMADISSDKDKPKNFGLVGMAFGLGFILGPYIGGKLSDPSIVSFFNLATPFWFAAFLSLVNILLVIKNLPETLKNKVHRPVSFTTGFKNLAKAMSMGNLRTLFTVVFLLTFGFSFFAQFFQVFLIQKFHYSQSQIGDLFAYIGLWIAITQGLLTRAISKKFSPTQILSVTILTLGLMFPLLLLPHKAIYLYFLLPFVAMSNGLTQPNSTTLISSLAESNSQGEILGISQSIQSLGMALPPLISGFIVSLNINLPILVACFCTLASWFVFTYSFKPKHKVKFQEV